MASAVIRCSAVSASFYATSIQQSSICERRVSRTLVFTATICAAESCKSFFFASVEIDIINVFRTFTKTLSKKKTNHHDDDRIFELYNIYIHKRYHHRVEKNHYLTYKIHYHFDPMKLFSSSYCRSTSSMGFLSVSYVVIYTNKHHQNERHTCRNLINLIKKNPLFPMLTVDNRDFAFLLYVAGFRWLSFVVFRGSRDKAFFNPPAPSQEKRWGMKIILNRGKALFHDNDDDDEKKRREKGWSSFLCTQEEKKMKLWKKHSRRKKWAKRKGKESKKNFMPKISPPLLMLPCSTYTIHNSFSPFFYNLIIKFFLPEKRRKKMKHNFCVISPPRCRRLCICDIFFSIFGYCIE